MSATKPEEAKISIKIMLQKDINKVIFAEADSNFVDILFSFLTLPLATIVRILEGCLDKKDVALLGIKNLYQSLKDLPANYFSTDESKYILLNPRISSTYDICRKLKLNLDDTEPSKYFFCRSASCYKKSGEYSLCKFAKCGKCGNNMDLEIKLNDSTANTGVDQVNGGVFVSELTTFIVTDDLRLMPNTSDTWVQLLSDHGITDSSQIEERTINVGQEQILVILKGALLSSFSLTYLVCPRTEFKWDLVGTFVQPLFKNEVVVTNTKRLKLKLTLQKSTSKFLFAEAEEDFVDFLFGFLGIPLGVVVGKLMNGFSSLDGLDNLFKSISSIGEGIYLKSQDIRAMLHEPKFLHKYLSLNQIFPLDVLKEEPRLCLHYFDMIFNNNTYLGRHGYICPPTIYSNESVSSLVLKDPRVKGSFLKATAKFMLTDDLCVTLLSPFSSIALLNKLQVPLNDVENHEVSIGIEEGLVILKASLNSSGKCLSALTSFLLDGNGMK